MKINDMTLLNANYCCRCMMNFTQKQASTFLGLHILRLERIRAGSCSFAGQPQNGGVEIAYWTFQEFEGQGMATFA